MGRVHKKKIAEYAESAENEKDVQEKETKKGAVMESGSSTEGEGDDKERGKAKKQGGPKVAKHTDTVSDDDFQSIQGERDQAEENNSPRKANKRKSAPEKVVDGAAEEGSDDEPLNGSDITTAKRGRKLAGKAKGKNGKADSGRKKAPVKDIDNGEEEYEVKDIVGQKIKDGVTYYLIRWKGYTKADDTWEPEDTLSCPDIIEKYKVKLETSKTAKKSTGTGRKGRPPSDQITSSDPNKEWEVDKIIDYAEEKNQRVFRIRWKGFGPKHDTWEPEQNLSCDEIINKFMKRMKDQENLSFKELREEPKKTKRLVNETIPRENYTARVERKSKRAGSKKSDE